MSEPIEQAKELLSQAVNCWRNIAGAGEFQQAQFLLIEQKLLLLVEASDDELDKQLDVAHEEGFEDGKREGYENAMDEAREILEEYEDELPPDTVKKMKDRMKT